MDVFVFVLIMHIAKPPAHVVFDDVFSVWDNHERCLVAAGLLAEDDRRMGLMDGTYECKKVTFNNSPPKK